MMEQYNYSQNHQYLYDLQKRQLKAKTMLSVLQEYYRPEQLKTMKLLSIGASTGIIENALAPYLNEIIGIDIDSQAIQFANNTKQFANITFIEASGLDTKMHSESFDIILCAHIYEHVPDPIQLMAEIYRLLKKQGICYFIADNRLLWLEPHYKLPLLSVLPKTIANKYLKLFRGIDHYYETLRTYWGLRKLCHQFSIQDMSKQLINHPEKYQLSYLLKPNSTKHRIAKLMIKIAYFLNPTYVWILKK